MKSSKNGIGKTNSIVKKGPFFSFGVILVYTFLFANPAFSYNGTDVWEVVTDENGVVQIYQLPSEVYGNFPPPGPWTGEMVIEQYQVDYGGFPLPTFPQGGAATMEEIFVTVSLQSFSIGVPPLHQPVHDYITCFVDMSGFEPSLEVGNPIPGSTVSFLVTVVAIKQGDPVAIEASTFGSIKSTFR